MNNFPFLSKSEITQELKKMKRLHEDAYFTLNLGLSSLCFVCACYKHARGSRSDPVKGPNEDVWRPRGVQMQRWIMD